MKILEELYYGNIDPHTRRVQPDSQLGKMRALLVQNENINRRRAQRKRVCGGSEEKVRLSMWSRCAGPHDITGFLLSRGRCSPTASASR